MNGSEITNQSNEAISFHTLGREIRTENWISIDYSGTIGRSKLKIVSTF